MEASGMGVSIGITTESQTLVVKDIGPIEEDLKRVEDAIKDILGRLNGHAYGNFIRSINTSEGLIREKNMSEGLMTVRALQEILKVWKVFIGSELYNLLQEKIKKNIQEYKEDYGMTDQEIRDNIENTELCTKRRIWKLREADRIYFDSKAKIENGTETDIEINTKGWVIFDSKNKIKTVPNWNESTKIIDAIELWGRLNKENKTIATQNSLTILSQFNVQWPSDAKWSIPQLYMVLEVMNLMYLKIELLWAKVMIDAFRILWQNVDRIIDRR